MSGGCAVCLRLRTPSSKQPYYSSQRENSSYLSSTGLWIMLQLLARFYQASAGSACGASSVRRLNGMFCLQDLDTGSLQERQYGSVIAACGHHWDPLWPELKGEFKGAMSHAHSYRSPKPFEGRRVLIIGGGNSGGGLPASNRCRSLACCPAVEAWVCLHFSSSYQSDTHCTFSGR